MNRNSKISAMFYCRHALALSPHCFQEQEEKQALDLLCKDWGLYRWVILLSLPEYQPQTGCQQVTRGPGVPAQLTSCTPPPQQPQVGSWAAGMSGHTCNQFLRAETRESQVKGCLGYIKDISKPGNFRNHRKHPHLGKMIDKQSQEICL